MTDEAYQARFLDPIRINAGVRFWRNNQATLQRAYEQFGVPPVMFREQRGAAPADDAAAINETFPGRVDVY